jgi:hypothetical protein
VIEGPPRIYSPEAMEQVVAEIRRLLADPDLIEGRCAVIPFEFNRNYHTIELRIT